MAGSIDLRQHPLAPQICPWALQLLSQLPAASIRCIGLEFASATGPVDLLLAIPIECLSQAATCLNRGQEQQQIGMCLQRLEQQSSLCSGVDHLWLELDHDRPGTFSTFLGHPGNVQGHQERLTLLEMCERCLIQPGREAGSTTALAQIKQRLRNSRLLQRIQQGRHVLSEVGWMNRGDASHLKLLITPGYQQRPKALLEHLLGHTLTATIEQQLLDPLSDQIDTNQEPLNVHLSLALGPSVLRAALEISHSPSQESGHFRSAFCQNLQQLPSLRNQASDMIEHWQSSQSKARSDGMNIQLSHLKIPISAAQLQLDAIKYYLRLIPVQDQSNTPT